MDLLVTQKNINSLKSALLLRSQNLLLGNDHLKSIKLRPDPKTEILPSFANMITEFMDFIKSTHLLERWLGIKVNVELADIPYCAFVSPQDRIMHLVENGNDTKKTKLPCCRLCKYQSLCGGILKNYLQQHGEKSFRPVRDIPYQVMIEVESRCNLNCRACFNRNTFAGKNQSSPPSLSTPLIKRTIEEIVRLKIPTIRFTGGEPLLRPDLYDLLSYAKSRGLYVILNSNGILINTETAKKLNGLIDTILVSIQGIGEKGDLAVGKKGATQAKIQALSHLKRFAKTEIFVSTVLRPEIMKNLSELDKIHKLIDNINCVSRWHLCRYIPEKGKDYRENNRDYKKLIDKLIYWQLGKQRLYPHNYPYVISNGIPFCFYNMEKVNLVSYGGLYVDGHSRISVAPNGHVKPIYYSSLNLADAPNILAAWHHPFLKSTRDLKFLPPACQNCRYKKKCLGGSRFLANLTRGDYSAPDPLMPLQ